MSIYREPMKLIWKTVCALALWLWLAGSVEAASKPKPSPWESSIVTIEATRLQYDYIQPWTQRNETSKKQGVVIGPGQILTTAEYLNDLVLARLQKQGRGPWVNAQLVWIDYHANLALLTTTNTNFWRGLKPVVLADPTPAAGSVQILRWRNGNLENRQAEIARLAVRRNRLSFLDQLIMDVDSEITGVGWGEPVTRDGKLVGLAYTQDGNNCQVIPSIFIKWVLNGANSKPRRQLGFFDFIWQKAENPATLSFLKLPGEPRGVIIIDKVTGPTHSSLLQPRDILLQVEGFKIDTTGNYADPDYGQLVLENLAARGKFAGDKVRMTVWREGRQMELDYPLPKVDYSLEMVPEEDFDRTPEYLVAGGLVFVPLNEPFMRSWGGDWRRKAPFRLTYFTQEKPTAERPSRVLLTLVLPDPINIGYQEFRFQPVDKVNGKTICQLSDLVAALEQPQGGYHRLEFSPGESVRTMILDAAAMEKATQRVLEKYGVPKDRVIH